MLNTNKHVRVNGLREGQQVNTIWFVALTLYGLLLDDSMTTPWFVQLPGRPVLEVARKIADFGQNQPYVDPPVF